MLAQEWTCLHAQRAVLVGVASMMAYMASAARPMGEPMSAHDRHQDNGTDEIKTCEGTKTK